MRPRQPALCTEGRSRQRRSEKPTPLAVSGGDGGDTAGAGGGGGVGFARFEAGASSSESSRLTTSAAGAGAAAAAAAAPASTANEAGAFCVFRSNFAAASQRAAASSSSMARKLGLTGERCAVRKSGVAVRSSRFNPILRVFVACFPQPRCDSEGARCRVVRYRPQAG